MSFKKHPNLDQRLLAHIRQFAPVSSKRLAEVMGCSPHTVGNHLYALAREGQVHLTGSHPIEKRWHLGPRATDSGTVCAPGGWSTPRASKQGHRIERETTEAPSGESWWTQTDRDRFTDEAVKRQAQMRSVNWAGAGTDAVRDTWDARPKRRGAEA